MASETTFIIYCSHSLHPFSFIVDESFFIIIWQQHENHEEKKTSFKFTDTLINILSVSQCYIEYLDHRNSYGWLIWLSWDTEMRFGDWWSSKQKVKFIFQVGQKRWYNLKKIHKAAIKNTHATTQLKEINPSAIWRGTRPPRMLLIHLNQKTRLKGKLLKVRCSGADKPSIKSSSSSSLSSSPSCHKLWVFLCTSWKSFSLYVQYGLTAAGINPCIYLMTVELRGN